MSDTGELHGETVELKYITPESGSRKWHGVATHDGNDVTLTVYANYIKFIRDHYPELEAVNKIGEQSSMGIDIVLSHRGSLIVMDGIWTKDDEVVMYADWRDDLQGKVNRVQERPWNRRNKRHRDPKTGDMFAGQDLSDPKDPNKLGINNTIGRNK